jgi:phenylpropionate dioxygenase-like ring-hydroxylating dioxygenase large terminal subunit
VDLVADLARGLSLPAAWYTDPAIATRERDRIFRRAWQYVGRTEQVERVGDYFTGVAGDVPIVVVRGPAGLRAFVNVCRHRRHEVMSGAGHRQTLQCPYHAWTYDLDGSLRAAPRSEHEPDFDRAELALLPARVATWGPFVFATPDPDALPFERVLGDLPGTVEASGVDLARLTFAGRETWTTDANWKVIVENFLECYHCPFRHPGFSAVVEVGEGDYSLRAHEWHSSQVAPVRPAAVEGRGRALAYDPRGAVSQAQYHFLWPNFTLSINPGQPNLEVDVSLPDGAERARGFTDRFFGPEVDQDYRQEMTAFNRQVSEEDERLTSSVQRGLRGGLPSRGRLLTKSEHLVAHFQRLVVSALA